MTVQDGFDCSCLDAYHRHMLQRIERDFPKQTRNFMQRAAQRLVKNTKATLDSTTKKKTGNLRRSISRGRAYVYKPGNDYQVRVKARWPEGAHGGLVEHGHEIYKRAAGGGYEPTGKRSKAVHFMGNTYARFDNEFVDMAEDFVADMVKRF